MINFFIVSPDSYTRRKHYLLQGVFGVQYKIMKKIALGCIFFFSFTALALFLFFTGNFQGFTTKALFFLLNILKFSSFLCALSGAAYLVLLVHRKLRTKRGFSRDFALAGLTFAFGLAVLLVSQFIIVLILPKL